MAIKIPQNIDKEDKLVGPLTLKQFLYILGGAGASFVVYQYSKLGYLFFSEFIIIGTLIMAVAVAFAFVKINGSTFADFIVHVFTFLFASKKSLWQKNNQLQISTINLKPKAHSNDKSQTENVTAKSHLEQLAQILDTGGKMNTETTLSAHEIDTLNPSINETSEVLEDKLGIEDILSDSNL